MQTANELVPVLKRKGVNAIVVLIHQGGTPGQAEVDRPGHRHDVRREPQLRLHLRQGRHARRDLADPADRGQDLDPAIDMVVSGHTHQPYVCDVEGPGPAARGWLTSASSFGRLFTETDLLYDKRTRDIVRSSVKGSNMQVSRDVRPGPGADRR